MVEQLQQQHKRSWSERVRLRIVCKQNSFLLRCFYVYIFYLIHFFFTSLFSPKKIFYPDIIRMFLSFSFVLYRSGSHLMR